MIHSPSKVFSYVGTVVDTEPVVVTATGVAVVVVVIVDDVDEEAKVRVNVVKVSENIKTRFKTLNQC